MYQRAQHDCMPDTIKQKTESEKNCDRQIFYLSLIQDQKYLKEQFYIANAKYTNNGRYILAHIRLNVSYLNIDIGARTKNKTYSCRNCNHEKEDFKHILFDCKDKQTTIIRNNFFNYIYENIPNISKLNKSDLFQLILNNNSTLIKLNIIQTKMLYYSFYSFIKKYYRNNNLRLKSKMG